MKLQAKEHPTIAFSGFVDSSVPNRPGQGGYGRPGKASVFHKDGSPMG